jgi:hypothetical protein
MDEMNEALMSQGLPSVAGYKCLAVDDNGKFTKDFYRSYSRGRRNVFDAESNRIWG